MGREICRDREKIHRQRDREKQTWLSPPREPEARGPRAGGGVGLIDAERETVRKRGRGRGRERERYIGRNRKETYQMRQRETDLAVSPSRARGPRAGCGVRLIALENPHAHLWGVGFRIQGVWLNI